MELILMNGARVEVSQEELNEFITVLLIPNPYWRHSGLLTEKEWMRYLKHKSSDNELKKVAQYILINMENLAFTSYLFDKADGDLSINTKEINLPIVIKLRDLFQKVMDVSHPSTDISQDVHEMEHLCMSIGADPL